MAKLLATLCLLVMLSMVLSQTTTETFSRHWERKLRSCFRRLDANKDGKATQADFEEFARRFCEVGGLTATDCEEVKNFYINQIWLPFFKPQNSDYSTEDEFIAILKGAGRANILMASNMVYERYFGNSDKDKNGLLNLDEFKTYFYIWGIDAKFAADTFKKVDVSGDGSLTSNEFITAGNNFSVGQQKDPASDDFYGPLIAENDIKIKIQLK